jgi:amidophosphoribosyltransferase
VRHNHSSIREFDTSCFSGEYVAGDVSDSYLDELEAQRNDAAKERKRSKDDDSSDADGPKQSSTVVAI